MSAGEALELRVQRWPFVQVPSALVVDPEVGDGPVRTYGALALWGGIDGRAFPSKHKLAAARRISISTLFDHLAQLERAGWVDRWPETKDGKTRHIIRVRNRPVPHQETGEVVSRIPEPECPDPRTQKESPERESGKTKSVDPGDPPPPWAESGLTQEQRGRLKAKALSKVYPHATTEGGNRREPGIKASAAAIVKGERAGVEFADILAAARRYAQAVQGTRDADFVPQMFRWLQRDGWDEVPEPVGGPEEEDPAAIADRIKRNADLDDEAKEKALAQAAVWAKEQAATRGAIQRIANKNGAPGRRSRRR